ncbi:hypothetical protein PIB30_083778, partial [Stylosanthes scabra]|nr:hypothetical protein [Stylosanthes scabra]
MLEESFPLTSNERLMFEKDCSRSIIRILPAVIMMRFNIVVRKRKRGTQWCEKLK